MTSSKALPTKHLLIMSKLKSLRNGSRLDSEHWGTQSQVPVVYIELKIWFSMYNGDEKRLPLRLLKVWLNKSLLQNHHPHKQYYNQSHVCTLSLTFQYIPVWLFNFCNFLWVRNFGSRSNPQATSMSSVPYSTLMSENNRKQHMKANW